MIKTFTGPMFSGKTTALLSTYFNMWNKKNILCFKPKMNTRDDGIKSKINMMPDKAKLKLQESLQKIVNTGSGGLIAIIL